MIASFKSEDAELIWCGFFSKKIKLPSHLHDLARRKLRMIAAAAKLETLRIPPNNRLELLGGDRKGEWSIRINNQWRICFKWQEGNAFDVEITDYHR
ncbi:MAG: type II toxin-antitoxin system RelE/ParE family toxin [Candidatus Tectomicrobia bacterium]|uniref:Type II toxin-antitoxin system RelE/ParE family toxin n=1 Tax=Tectimicrobiota bacterium TaxID=2528274 RepID=A0A933LQV8_UNCTE|nr:type II toxin-antitoxin system RelE/ParE family toxin [Candidatus Tectomicrobia bacterium]